MTVYAQAQEAAQKQRREAEGAAASRAAKDKMAAERAEKARVAEVARVAAIKESIEATLAPWRKARDARPGLKWTPAPKPVFISYAAEGSYDELAFVQSLAALLNDSGQGAEGGRGRGAGGIIICMGSPGEIEWEGKSEMGVVCV